ncbi:MAG: GxxExxY protein [Bacteroidota bacterium]
MHENEIATSIIQTSIELHKKLGPGLLESVYENTLAYDLNEKGFHVDQQVPIPLVYKEIKFDVGSRLDLLINKKVIIEIKSVDVLAPVHYAQLLTYLKLSELKLGLLINFNVNLLKEGIHRVVNKL